MRWGGMGRGAMGDGLKSVRRVGDAERRMLAVGAKRQTQYGIKIPVAECPQGLPVLLPSHRIEKRRTPVVACCPIAPALFFEVLELEGSFTVIVGRLWVGTPSDEFFPNPKFIKAQTSQSELALRWTSVTLWSETEGGLEKAKRVVTKRGCKCCSFKGDIVGKWASDGVSFEGTRTREEDGESANTGEQRVKIFKEKAVATEAGGDVEVSEESTRRWMTEEPTKLMSMTPVLIPRVRRASRTTTKRWRLISPLGGRRRVEQWNEQLGRNFEGELVRREVVEVELVKAVCIRVRGGDFLELGFILDDEGSEVGAEDWERSWIRSVRGVKRCAGVLGSGRNVKKEERRRDGVCGGTEGGWIQLDDGDGRIEECLSDERRCGQGWVGLARRIRDGIEVQGVQLLPGDFPSQRTERRRTPEESRSPLTPRLDHLVPVCLQVGQVSESLDNEAQELFSKAEKASGVVMRGKVEGG
ncbi:hypothetical protein BC829DRAFT_418874 [Chytridium lagenaria]|nr:hypothetical protein BC829DRAFT_418874 [Chytridium lagenaria]